jgi:anti-sigma regulatory factor (Ser/Thr protein kinase)
MESFVHEALLYRDAAEFLAGTVPFVTAGLGRDEPVLVAAPPDRLGWLRDALGGEADRVGMRDMRQVGRNPGRILPAVLLAFARVGAVGEPIWPGRSRLEYPACVQHEALINAAFAGREAAILCAYDVAGLDPSAVEDAERTHPRITTPAGGRPSARFVDPVATAAEFNLPLPPPPDTAVRVPVALIGLTDLRRLVADQARAAGVPSARVGDVVIAVNELASNSIAHAGGSGTLAGWTEDGHLVYQLTDGGHLADPLAGRVPPPPDAAAGRGLFVVNQVCDLVRIHTEPGRTTVRIQVTAG